jgi:trypsin-like peptidase
MPGTLLGLIVLCVVAHAGIISNEARSATFFNSPAPGPPTRQPRWGGPRGGLAVLARNASVSDAFGRARTARAQAPRTPTPDDVLAMAERSTWGVANVQFSSAGRLERLSLLGSGFFVSRNHFVTAQHVISEQQLGRIRGPLDQIRIFRTEPNGRTDFFKGTLKSAYQNVEMDAAILQSSLPAPSWLTISRSEPKEGEEIGMYGYPLANFDSMLRMKAFVVGRRGIVFGYGRQGNIRRMISTLTTNPGNSGAPEFLIANGEAVAIHKAQLLDAFSGKEIVGHSISTPLSSLLPEFEKLGIAVGR